MVDYTPFSFPLSIPSESGPSCLPFFSHFLLQDHFPHKITYFFPPPKGGGMVIQTTVLFYSECGCFILFQMDPSTSPSGKSLQQQMHRNTVHINIKMVHWVVLQTHLTDMNFLCYCMQSDMHGVITTGQAWREGVEVVHA